MPELKDAAPAPHHTGHRDRLRERFAKSPDALPDYELLELLLFTLIPRKDVKPIAKDLIAQFGDLRRVLAASPEALAQIKGLSETTSVNLKIIQAAGLRALKQEIMSKPVLSSWADLIAYLNAAMADQKREEFRLLFLNKKNELIADEVQGTGTVDHTPAYPREILKRALELGATALILVHNHPSGDPTPSQADIDLTKAVIQAAEPFEITIHDHLIIASSGHTSLRQSGYL